MEDLIVTVLRAKRRHVETLRAQSMESSKIGHPGESAPNHVAAEYRRETGNVMVHSTAELNVSASPMRLRPATRLPVPSTGSGANGAIGPTAQRLAQEVTLREAASARAPSMVAGTATVRPRRPRSATKRHVPSMATGKIGECGENATRNAAGARRSVQGNALGLNMEELIAVLSTVESTSNSRVAILSPVPLMDIGKTGDHGARASMANKLRSATASTQ